MSSSLHGSGEDIFSQMQFNLDDEAVNFTQTMEDMAGSTGILAFTSPGALTQMLMQDDEWRQHEVLPCSNIINIL